jgi:chromosome segregation ATPase
MKDQIELFRELNDKLNSLNEKKIRFEEQLKSKKKDFISLRKEIEDAGYDPTKLSVIKKEKEDQVKVDIENFEKKVNKVSEQLSEIEAA